MASTCLNDWYNYSQYTFFVLEKMDRIQGRYFDDSQSRGCVLIGLYPIITSYELGTINLHIR